MVHVLKSQSITTSYMCVSTKGSTRMSTVMQQHNTSPLMSSAFTANHQLQLVTQHLTVTALFIVTALC
jgi:hypothetical protein